MRVHLIQDSRGRIIATIPAGAGEFRTTLPGVPVTTNDADEVALEVEVMPEPLKGQTIHEVELPPELEAIEEGPELHEGAMGLPHRGRRGKTRSTLIIQRVAGYLLSCCV